MMSSFKNLEIKPVYDSRDDIKSFYNDVLTHAILYRRASGYFSHKLLKLISKGLLGLIRNSGKLELIISNQVDEETYEKITKGYKLKDINFNRKISGEEDLSDLAFLISLGLVDIRVAITNGVYHEKYGIVYDSHGNKILFSGSNNETHAALEMNFESFETTLSWEGSDRDIEKINYREESFNDTWFDKNSKLRVYDMPKAIITGVLEQLDVSKTISKIPEKVVYIDKDEQLELIMNFDFDHKQWFMIKRWGIIIESKSSRTIRFKSSIKHQDILKIIDKTKRFFSEQGIKTLVTKTTEDYIIRNSLNISYLEKQGLRIKSKEYFSSNHFLNFKDEINQLLKRDLRDAQIQSADHIVSVQRSMNFSVPGSGKTATVLGAYAYLASKRKVDKLLVIGPKNCFKSWIDEIETVLGISKEEILELNTTSDYAGKRIQLQYNYKKSKVILLNYDGTVNGSKILSKYVNTKVMIVFDEIHRLKRVKGVMFEATKPLVKDTVFRVALTGTPLPNGYLDLYNQFLLLYDDYARIYFGFHQHKLNEYDNDFDKKGLLSKEVTSKLYPFYVRVSKGDLNVPKALDDHIVKVEESSQNFINYPFSKGTASLSLIDHMRLGIIPETIKSEKNNVMTESGIFEQFERTHHFKVDLVTPKLQKILNLVNDIISRNEKVIIWFNFISSMLKTHYLLKNMGLNVGIIYGAVDSDIRNNIIDDFNNNDMQVLIANPHTLAESVSLHKKCNNAIYAELNYNLSQYLQSRDRIHRLGIEDNRVTNYYIVQLYVDGESFDKKIYDILNSKELKMYDTIEGSMLITRDEKLIKNQLFCD